MIRHVYPIATGGRASGALWRAAAALAIALLVTVRPLAAQDLLSRAKELYEAANYQEALRLIDSEGDKTGTPDERQSAREEYTKVPTRHGSSETRSECCGVLSRLTHG